MLLSVLIRFYGKKISVPEFLRSARSSFLLFPIKKENRQRLYNLLSIFILKLIKKLKVYSTFSFFCSTRVLSYPKHLLHLFFCAGCSCISRFLINLCKYFRIGILQLHVTCSLGWCPGTVRGFFQFFENFFPIVLSDPSICRSIPEKMLFLFPIQIFLFFSCRWWQ